MAEPSHRMKRIENLLNDLEFEIKRGVLEDEIPEEMTYRFVIPVSHSIKQGVVQCYFTMRPVPRGQADNMEPKLRVVK